MSEALNSKWVDLFAAASAFRELRPWAWMTDGQVFGVKEPTKGEIAWCAMLGMRGEVFGLAAYLGTAGLSIHRGIQADKFGPDDDEIRFGFPCLIASFEDRQGLEVSDLALIRSLGLTFRGRKSWPQFRSHRRGWYPWRLERSEVGFLTDVLRQALVVCSRLRSEPDYLKPYAQQLLVRVNAKDGDWVDQWMEPSPLPSVASQEPTVDKHEVVRLKASVSRQEGIWEADLFYVPTPTREKRDERPYYPVAMVWADQRSGMVLAMELLPQADDPDLKAQALTARLLALVTELDRIPRALKVLRPALATALSGVAEILGCELLVSRHLQAMEELKESLFRRFAGR